MNKVFKRILGWLSVLIGPDIFSATKSGNIDRVKSILAQKPQLINAKNKEGGTALHYAVCGGFKDIAEFLIKKGAEVNAKYIDGSTPLHFAASGGHADVVGKLVVKKADINARNDRGETALHIAVRKYFENKTGPPSLALCLGNHIEVIKRFALFGADFDVKNAEGENALHLAARAYRDCATPYAPYGRVIESFFQGSPKDIVQLLITKVKDINAGNNHGKTALDVAVEEGHNEAAQILRENGAKKSNAVGPTQVSSKKDREMSITSDKKVDDWNEAYIAGEESESNKTSKRPQNSDKAAKVISMPLSEPQDQQRGISVMLVALRWNSSPLSKQELRSRAAKAVQMVDTQFDKDVMDVKLLEVNEGQQYVQLSVRANFCNQEEQERMRDALNKEFVQ